MKLQKLIILLPLLIWACGPSEEDKKLESLHEELIKGHDVVMPKSMQLPKLKERVNARVEGMDETADSVKLAQDIGLNLTKANEDMYKWMDDFADAMQNSTRKKEKIELYNSLKAEIGEIGKDTDESIAAAKQFLNEE